MHSAPATGMSSLQHPTPGNNEQTRNSRSYREAQKKVDFPGKMQCTSPKKSFPQICVVTRVMIAHVS